MGSHGNSGGRVSKKAIGYWGILGIYVLMAVYDVLAVGHCFTTVKMSFN